ncbi:hypothetical protein ACFC5Z_23835 [Streptomyces sp. NPDC056004]|uniref:hypothetical protein n=1 Tax=unclassified Streptomyces TaxID=2593676 RepID=UPI0035D8E292
MPYRFPCRARDFIASLDAGAPVRPDCLGRYSFAAHQPVEGLRPLRDPATVHLGEGDERTSE